MNNKERSLPVASPSMSSSEVELVTDAVKSGWVSSLGKYVDQFEEDFSRFCGTKYCVVVANGTAALHLALVVVGIGPGDEVIAPSLTFVATANAITYCGATPVFVDSDPEIWCLDPRAVEAALTARTRAIVTVHVYGHPADMSPILELAQKNNLKVIEDAAEAHGAEYKGRRVGGIGDVGVFSFYGNKIVTTGEGGALVTNSPSIAMRARYLKDQAMSRERKYMHEEIGFNYRMTNLQAALGVAQLRRIDELLIERQTYLKWYKDELGDMPNIRLNPQLTWAKSVNWMVCLDLRNYSKTMVENLQVVLREDGVDSRPFFVPLHLLPPYRKYLTVNAQGEHGHCDVAEALSDHCINVPSGYGLTQADVERVCKVIKKVLNVSV